MNRIVVAFATEDAQLRMSRLLESSGTKVVNRCATGAETIRTLRKMGSGVVICSFKLKDMTANDLAQRLLGIGVVLCVSSPVNLSYCQGENIFRLPTPVVRGDFHASVNILNQLENQTLRHAAPRRGDADKQTIASAKARLMETEGMSEDEAHRYLQKTSMDAGRTMVETARTVLGA